MHLPLTLRAPTEAAVAGRRALAHDRKAAVRLRDRARICWLAHWGRPVPPIAADLGVGQATARTWLKRFTAAGLDGPWDAGRSGRPPTSTTAAVGEVGAANLTTPEELALPVGSWPLDRLEASRNEPTGIPIKRSRIGEILVAEGRR